MKKSISLCVSGLAVLIAGFTIADSNDVTEFSVSELRAFAALQPIDTHTHAFKPDSSFYAMMDRLHLRVLDICVANRNDPSFSNLASKITAAKSFVKDSNGR